MEDRQTFRYNYSAKQNKEVADIRRKYLPHEVSKIETLRALDLRVRMAGKAQSITLGTLGALIFGIGLCFGLGVFMGGQWPAVLLCALGMILMTPAYPVSRHIAKRVKAQLAPEILRLSDEIIGERAPRN